jgi:predicted membrane channel-forming protein YqfA (hemolysin III family)
MKKFLASVAGFTVFRLVSFTTLVVLEIIPTFSWLSNLLATLLMALPTSTLAVLTHQRWRWLKYIVAPLTTIGVTILLMGPRIAIYFETAHGPFHFFLHCFQWTIAAIGACIALEIDWQNRFASLKRHTG